VQRLWEAGEREHAEQRFDQRIPFVMWTMQSIDHSVTAAKVELYRRGVIASARLRQPALALDAIGLGQLARFLDRRLADPE
jgi:dihydrodipicolinate synthase/N-acetylneuraminate lyase